MSANKEQTDDRIIFIHGPGWRVELEVYRQKDAEAGHDYTAMRSLAIERQDLDGNDGHHPLLLHVAGRIVSLKLLPGSSWPSISGLKIEEASFIVCRQERIWLPQEPPNPQNTLRSAPGVFTCVAAEVLLSDAAGEFNRKPQIRDFFDEILIDDAARLRTRQFWITSAGFKLGGVIRLPWSDELLGGVFDLVGRGKKDPPRDPRPIHEVDTDPVIAHEFGWFRMRIDPTRTSADEMDQFAAVFAQIGSFLEIHAQRSPAWANLELTGMAAAEALTWFVGTQDESRPQIFRRHHHLNLEPGTLRLRLTDQHPAAAPAALLGPLTAATATFGWTVVKREKKPGMPDTLEFSFEQDEQPKLDERWPATVLEYLASGGTPAGIAENFSLGELNRRPDFPAAGMPTPKQPAILYLDPVEAPALVREAWGMPEPLDEARDPGVANSPWILKRDPVIWAFMPLADGWAQLPLPNLSERLFRDHFDSPASATTATTAGGAASATDVLLEGALSLGIHRPELLARRPDRQPWSLNLDDAAGLKGKWILTLTPAGPELVANLDRAWVAFREPRLTLLGALWLGTRAPSAADAISDHDFWSSSAVPLGLFTHRAFTTHLPALLSVAIADFLTQKSVGSDPAEAGIAFPGLAAATLIFQRQHHHWDIWEKVLDQAPFMDFQPLLWQRDPRLPHVQNLPLTQTLSPPAYPSPSRQLLPRKLPRVTRRVTFYGAVHDRFENWCFTLGLDAREWPAFQQSAIIASAPLPCVGDQFADLSAAALLLPGVQQDLRRVATRWTAIATPADYQPAHPLTLRHDLPYCDELHALARLPKKKSASIELEEALLQDVQEPAILAPPTFTAHWENLNELAILAAADGVLAIAAHDIAVAPANGTALQWIYADLPWTTAASIAWTTSGGDEKKAFLPVLHFADGSLNLSGESALEGLSASFNIVNVGGNPTLRFVAADGDLHLLAGSMSARNIPGTAPENTLLADQRGLLRAATGRPAAGDHLLRTALTAPAPVPALGQTTTALISTRIPLSLDAPSGEFSWSCFFCDLPCDASGKFSRPGIGYAPLTVNDEDAMTRERNHLRGYEWRLAAAALTAVAAAEPDPSDPPPPVAPGLDFFGLLFLPLQLEEYSPTRLVILGRLQLTLAPEDPLQPRLVEQPQVRNVIRITFSSTDGQTYQLAAVEAVSSQGIEWPLALEREEVTMKPRLRAQRVLLSQATATAPRRLRLEGLTLAFREFAADWSVSLDPAELVPPPGLPAGSPFRPAPILLQKDSDASPDDALRARRIEVTLDPASGQHQAKLELQLRLGTDTPAAWPPLDFTLKYDLMQVRHSQDGILKGVSLTGASAFKAPCKIGTATDPTTVIEATDRSLALSWKGLEQEISLIDGLPLLPGKCSGSGTCHFTMAAARTAAGFRAFGLLSGHVELLLAVRGGRSLFADLPETGEWKVKADELHHEPCHAVLDAAFVSNFTPAHGTTTRDTWGRGRFLFCGLLECHNLISWPTEWLADGGGTETVKLPPISAPHHHARHSIRCFLNQHDLATAFGPGREGETMLDIGSSARLLCPVEHQVLLLKQDGEFYEATMAHRWTTVQEVRLFMPAKFADMLEDLGEHKTHSHRITSRLSQIQECCDGYFREGLKDELVQRLKTLKKSLVVEAGTSAWLGHRATLPAELALTDLLILPSGEAEAALSLPEDFVRKPEEPEDFWLLLQMPFLGRLSKAGKGPGGCEWPDPLQEDELKTKLGRWMSHRAEQLVGLTLTLGIHDLPRRRKLPALDSLMLLRNQERAVMGLPLVHRDLPSVIEAVPSEAAGYGDPLALQRRFAPDHAQAGKILAVPDPAAGVAGGALTWLRAALMVFQACYAASTPVGPEHAWIAPGLHLLRGGIFPPPGAAEPAPRLAHHAAATIVFPAALVPDAAERPLSLVCSPYAKLNLRLIEEPTPGSPGPAREVLGRHLELIAIDPLSAKLGVIATRFLSLTPGATPEDLVRVMKSWGDGMLRRMAPESPVGLVRAREVTVGRSAVGRNRVPAADRVVSLQYHFLPLTARPPALQQPLFALRPAALELVFREAHFGGITLPAHAQADDFELAPPLVCEALPIRISNPQPPGSAREQAVYDRWPYGYSAYRMDVQFAQDRVSATTATAGDRATAFKFRIWWQSLQQDVEYRPNTHPDGGSDLPDDFRAEPIEALSPLIPSAMPPPVGKEPLYLSEPDWQGYAQTQAVLPGATRTLMINSRPGVIYSLRHVLFTQTSFESGDAGSFIASSLPFQARFPRPVAIPPNREDRREGFCQQAWPSYYEPSINPGRGRDASDLPFDEASILPLRRGTDTFTGRATVRLAAPTAGLIDPGWNGFLSFQFGSDADPRWRLTISFITAQGEVLWDSLTAPDGTRSLKGVKNSPDPQRIVDNATEHERLKESMAAARRRGSAVYAVLRCFPPGTFDPLATADGADLPFSSVLLYHQELRFRLEIGDSRLLPLPLRPRFFRFEDPAYNEKLESPAVTRRMTFRTAAGNVEYSLTVDRSHFNPTSTLYLKFSTNLPPLYQAIEFVRRDRAGMLTQLRLRSEFGSDVAPPWHTLHKGQLYALPLTALVGLKALPHEEQALLRPDDVLLIKLLVKAAPNGTFEPLITLEAFIVESPVLPAPESAYALLALKGAEGEASCVECARFAWTPQPQRIELVNPADLDSGFVRRRAVYQWTDSCRAARSPYYFLQKIAPNGATHFIP
ncbi:MAG: hypothetical protein JWM59_27 [Verrucomicrobiales bacterium]|nr:hypothetical protein [Verrucomicrobiales bacterium]